MAFQMTMGMTYAGREPEVLNDLILRRQKLFGETAQEAVIGTGIAVMTSLRAQTRIANENEPIGFKESSRQLRFITKDKKYKELEIIGRPNDGKFVNLAKPYMRGVKHKLFEVKKMREGSELTIFIVAYKESDVQAYLKKRIRRYKGMAKSAWGHLMRMTSQREPDAEQISQKAIGVLRENLSVISGGNQYIYAMKITDDLQYAASALKGGPSSVSHAMQAASNKIAGRIKMFIKEHPRFSDQRIETPFPEIKTRK